MIKSVLTVVLALVAGVLSVLILGELRVPDVEQRQFIHDIGDITICVPQTAPSLGRIVGVVGLGAALAALSAGALWHVTWRAGRRWLAILALVPALHFVVPAKALTDQAIAAEPETELAQCQARRDSVCRKALAREPVGEPANTQAPRSYSAPAHVAACWGSDLTRSRSRP
jgi:hypothetical protein